MELAAVLMWRFPGREESYSVTQDPETGEHRISRWDAAAMGAPPPTAAQLAEWEAPAARFRKRRELRRAADAEYEAIFAVDGEFLEMERDAVVLKTAMGRALLPAEQSKRAQMVATRDKLQTKLAQANAPAATPAEVEAIAW